MLELLEYSEKNGFYITQNRSNQNKYGRVTLQDGIDGYLARKFTRGMRISYPGMWRNDNPPTKIILSKFLDFKRKHKQ